MPTKPTWLREWEQAVLKSRALVRGPGSLTAAQLEFMEDALADALVQLERIFQGIPLSEDTLKANRAQALFRNIQRVLEGKRQELDTSIGDAISKTINGVAGAHELGAIKALEAVGVNVGFDFSRVPTRVLEVMAVRRGLGISENWRSLNAKAFGQTYLGVDRFLASQVAQGIGAEQVKRRLAYMMATNAQGQLDEGLMRALRARGVAGKSFERLLRRAKADPTSMGFDNATQAINQLTAARGLLINTRRIAVSEINTAFTEAQRVSSVESPVVGALKWTLSSRHRTIPSSPDICDTLASRNLYGLGPGIYPPEVCPAPPHPNCGCSRRSVTRGIDEWDQPKPTPRKPRSVSWEDVRRDYGKKENGEWVLSEKRARKAAARFNEQTGTAYRVWRDGEDAIGPITPPRGGNRPGPAPAPTRAPRTPTPPTPAPAAQPAPSGERQARLTPRVTEGNPFIGPDGQWLEANQVIQYISDDQEMADLFGAIDNSRRELRGYGEVYEAAGREAFDAEQTLLQQFVQRVVNGDPKEYRKINKLIYYGNGLEERPGALDIRISYLEDRFEDSKELAKKRLAAKVAADKALEGLTRASVELSDLNEKSKQRGAVSRKFLQFAKPADFQVRSIETAGISGVREYPFVSAHRDQVFDAAREWAYLAGEGVVDKNTTLTLSQTITQRGYHRPFSKENEVAGLTEWLRQAYQSKRKTFKWDRPTGTYIHLDLNPETVVHEMGHWVEFNNLEWFRKVRNYLSRRTSGKRVRPFSELDPSYGPQERGWDVDSKISFYVWKTYIFNGQVDATELTSMALEMMYRNPYELATQDPDLFRFMYNLLREVK